ncbi:MAG: hypothetical protein Q8O67_09345 [Deltaproteobacteria bacterium]|nr:hypothetical protein [Deltaproteobacteria bacterium]
MKKARIPTIAAVALLVALGCDPPPKTTETTTTTAPARAAAVQRGVALGLFASDPGYDYGVLLDEIARTGATDVLIAVVWGQARIDSARVHRSAAASTTSADDATILRTLLQARALGLRATLFPIVRLEEHKRDEWRGRLAPKAGVDAWFSSYRDFLLLMADLATHGGAAGLSVGSELLSLERHEGHWRSLIADVRARFAGSLLYSANWDHYQPIRFWDAVDVVGITAYFELAPDDGSVSDDDLAAAWVGPRRELLAFARAQGRPLVLTEVGYPSRTTAAWHPWDETARARFDFALQARLYAAFCESWKHSDVGGFYVWNWFGFGGDDDGGYTPRGKPAAATLARCLKDPAWGPSERGPADATRAP